MPVIRGSLVPGAGRFHALPFASRWRSLSFIAFLAFVSLGEVGSDERSRLAEDGLQAGTWNLPYQNATRRLRGGHGPSPEPYDLIFLCLESCRLESFHHSAKAIRERGAARHAASIIRHPASYTSASSPPLNFKSLRKRQRVNFRC